MTRIVRARPRYSPAETIALNDLIGDPDATVEERIRDISRSEFDSLYDSDSRQWVDKAEVIEALRKFAPRPLAGGDTKVYHATDASTAKMLLRRGLIPETKPRPPGDIDFEYAPGRGLDIGLYVGATPREVSGYGRVILEVVVPKKYLEVPTEQAQLGETDPMRSLRGHDGAIINHRLPADAFRILPDGKLASRVIRRFLATRAG